MNYNQVHQHQVFPQQVVILQQQQQQQIHQGQHYMVNSNNAAILIPNNNVVINNLSPATSQTVSSNSNLASSSNVYVSLLGLADSFLKSSQYRCTIHCLETILTLKLTDVSINAGFHIFLKTRLNLCRLYLKHTINTNQYVNAHLEKAIILVQNLKANDEYKYEATYVIYKIFQKQKELQNQLRYQQQEDSASTDPTQLISIFSLDLMRHILESSKTFPLWHVRLLFLIGNLLLNESDYNGAAYYMSIGIEFCATNGISPYTHNMFILSKGLIHLLQRNPNDLQTTMQPCASLIESFQTNNMSQIETLKIFFLVLQVTYFLQCGQMKSVKNTLRSLQHYIQSLTSRNDTSKASSNENELINPQNPLENFYWLHKEHLAILVYLLTVIHSTQTGSFEKSQINTEKALLNVQKLKLKEHSFNRSSFITNKFHYLFLENQIRSNITVGNRCNALKYLGEAFQLCEQESILMQSNVAQLHCLLGIYCLSVNLRETAVAQFNQSLQLTKDNDLWLYNVMSLALCYLSSWTNFPDVNTGNAPIMAKNLSNLLEKITPDKIQTQNGSINAFANFFSAIKFFLSSNYQQAQDALRETILLANSEDLSNITAQSFLFMGHVNFLMNQFQESFSSLNNGIEIADKMSDITLKIYGNSLLKDLFKYFNDPREADVIRKLSDFEQKHLLDCNDAVKMPQHALIGWNTKFSPKQILMTIQRSFHQNASSTAPSVVMPPPSSSSIAVGMPNNMVNSSPVQKTHQTPQTTHHQSPSQHVQNASPQTVIAQQPVYQHSPQAGMVRSHHPHPQQFQQQSQQTATPVKSNLQPQIQHQRTPTNQHQFSPASHAISNPHQNQQSPYNTIQAQQQQQFSPVNQQRPNVPHQMQQNSHPTHNQQQLITTQSINYQPSPNMHNQNFQAIQQQQQLQHQQMIFHQQQLYSQIQSHHPTPHNNQ